MIYTALIGHGVVGSGVAEIMTKQEKKLSESIKEDIKLKYILDLRKFEGLPYSDKFINDFNIILNDDSVKVVVEVIGGLHPAFDFVKACLQKGKSVVTSNKELVAEKGYELIKTANENNANFLFEASVGGTIPIIRPLTQCLVANDIKEIYGILNGTTNYILNKMIVDSMDFDTALKLAQNNGYAEKNPASDIEGLDACRKICILATLAFGKHIYPKDVSCEGITNVTLDDVAYANNFGYVIKLIGKAAKEENGKISIGVAPTLVSKDEIISNVNGVYNAIMVKGDSCDDVMFYGRGAGKLPTASAVVADVVDCAKHLGARKYISWEDSEEGFITEPLNSISYYVLCQNNDFSSLKNSFKDIAENVVKSNINEDKNEIAFITKPVSKDLLNNILNSIKSNSTKTYKII
ncbi:MAG: homoserine dehydrogenase [Clostridia bacterium]|nr:homoserine dehydrogenase [Clostridia bacterium]